jgi:hypothetical protein
MSRVDDDREAARQIERMQLQKQQADAKAKDKSNADSAFSKLVRETAQQQSQAQKKKADGQQSEARLSSAVLEEAMAEMMAQGQDQSKQAQNQSYARLKGQAFNEKMSQARSGEGERMGQSRTQDSERQGSASASRGQDARTSEARAESRLADAKLQREADAKDAEAASRKGGGPSASGDRGDVSTDADSGGGGQGGDKKDGNDGAMAAGFRFNPALMAPVPVAKPKDTGASDRLRALAQEIAQKIVERVRVGTNAAGAAEFQIDLRSNVLKGLSIKVSGGNGKIKAVFSGSDREVMKLLKQQSEGLKSALAGRGLTLEELRIEERA